MHAVGEIDISHYAECFMQSVLVNDSLIRLLLTVRLSCLKRLAVI